MAGHAADRVVEIRCWWCVLGGWRCLSLAAVVIAHRDVSSPQRCPDGLGIDAEPVSDPGRGPALLVEAYRLFDAVVVQALSPACDTLAVQVSGDGGAVETEAVGEFVYGLPGAVALDEVSDLLC